MSSLENELEVLFQDLTANPMRIAAHSDMPFAIFRYTPADEFELRRRLRLCAYSLQEKHHRRVHFISLSRLVWDIVGRFEGVEYLYKVENKRSFGAAQMHANNLLTSPDFRPITDEVLETLQGMNSTQDIVFLVRTGGFAPFIYRCSNLLEGLHGHTSVPIVLFYPGSALAGTDLRFYDLPTESNLGVYNYRVRVYGVQS